MADHSRKYLDTSTAHISPAAVEWLDKVSGGYTVAKFEYGWFWLVPQAPDDLLHEDLRPIADHASKLGCHHVLFDRDAAPIDGLPVYEW
jgi:hypothetical protein